MEASSLDAIAVALADEGVPIRAIACATKIPSADLRERLGDAKDIGDLVELPCDEWPPGYPRDKRIVQPARLVASLWQSSGSSACPRSRRPCCWGF
jgi:hypothetical protein